MFDPKVSPNELRAAPHCLACARSLETVIWRGKLWKTSCLLRELGGRDLIEEERELDALFEKARDLLAEELERAARAQDSLRLPE